MPYELTYNFLTLSMRHPISVSQSSDSMRYAMLRCSCDVQIVLVRVFPFFGKSISRVTMILLFYWEHFRKQDAGEAIYVKMLFDSTLHTCFFV